MSIRFSRVSAMTNKASSIFLVGGVPGSQEDLDGWTSFDDFVRDLPKDEVITAHIETFLYGEEEAFDATPEEVAYIYMRMEKNPDFIETRTKKVMENDLVLWLNK